MSAKKTTQLPFIQSLDRGITVLHAVAASKQPLTLGELAKLLEIDRSSAFRLAQTLRRRGFLAIPPHRKDYILGSAIWTLARSYDWSNMLVHLAHDELKSLASSINETAHVAIREGKSALFIDSAHATHVIAVTGQIGELVPLYCTAHGKALLADAGEQELRALFGTEPLKKFTRSTIGSVAALARECREIGERGYATDEAEFRNDMRCVAVPIRLQSGTIVGSIGISAPASRFKKEQYAAHAKQVLKAAKNIGALLSANGE